MFYLKKTKKHYLVDDGEKKEQGKAEYKQI